MSFQACFEVVVECVLNNHRDWVRRWLRLRSRLMILFWYDFFFSKGSFHIRVEVRVPCSFVRRPWPVVYCNRSYLINKIPVGLKQEGDFFFRDWTAKQVIKITLSIILSRVAYTRTSKAVWLSSVDLIYPSLSPPGARGKKTPGYMCISRRRAQAPKKPRVWRQSDVSSRKF